MKERPYYIQIRNQEQEVIEEMIDYLALDDNLIINPDGSVPLVIRYIKGDGRNSKRLRPRPRRYYSYG